MKLDIVDIEKALESASKFSMPDVSGGCSRDGDFLYFKNKEGLTSLIMHVDAYKNLINKLGNNDR